MWCSSVNFYLNTSLCVDSNSGRGVGANSPVSGYLWTLSSTHHNNCGRGVFSAHSNSVRGCQSIFHLFLPVDITVLTVTVVEVSVQFLPVCTC